MSEENKAIVRRLFQEVINEGNLALVDELLTSNYVHHDPANPGVEGPEGYKELVSKYRTAFSDIRLTIEDMVAEGEKIVVRWTWSGTHDGDLEGIAPTGTHTTGMGISIDRFSGGKIEESCNVWDALGLMRQLGVVA